MPDTIFEGFVLCTWEVNGDTFELSVVHIEEEGGNRLVERERPNRDGAKIDDTGSKAKRWTLTCDWYNSSTEPGIPAANYPDVLNGMLVSFDVHDTGTLTLPNIGPRRCRAATYRRIETSEERDSAATTFTFIEDNEDGTTSSSFLSPSARSVIVSMAEATTFSLESAGVSPGNFLSSLNELAADIEGILMAPGRFVQDLETKVKAMDAACKRIEDAFTGAVPNVTGEASKLLALTGNSLAVRQLRKLRDVVRRAVGEHVSSRPTTIVRMWLTPRSIFDIAVELGQDPIALIDVNPGLDNLLMIPARTPVLVFNG